MNAEKILIRMPNWVGDFIMALPAAEILRKTYPDAKITWMARPYLYDLALFRSDLFDHFIPFDDKQANRTLKKLHKFGCSLRAESFSRAFLFTKHFRAAFISWSAKIPEVIGYSQPYLSFLLTHSIKRPKRHTSDLHDTHVYLNLLSESGLNVSDSVMPSLNVDHTLKEEVAAQYLNGPKSPHLFIHAGAATSAAKMWLPSRFAEIANRFIQQTSGFVVLLGIESETQINDELMKDIQQKESIINIVGKTSLKQSVALLGSADLLLSNDSGMMHVASALQIPLVAVFGPTDPRQVMPHSARSISINIDVDCGPCHKKTCPLDHRCMVRIPADRVWEEGIVPLLNSNSRL